MGQCSDHNRNVDIKGHMLKVKERVALGNALCVCQFNNCVIYLIPWNCI